MQPVDIVGYFLLLPICLVANLCLFTGKEKRAKKIFLFSNTAWVAVGFLLMYIPLVVVNSMYLTSSFVGWNYNKRRRE